MHAPVRKKTELPSITRRSQKDGTGEWAAGEREGIQTSILSRGTDTKTVEFADCDTRTVFLLGRSATVERQLDESSSSLYATCTPSPYMLRPLYLV